MNGPLTGHAGGVVALAFSPDERLLVSGSYDKTVRIWDTETGRDVFGALEGHTGMVGAVAFSQHGRQVASGSHDSTIRVWDAATGRSQQPFEGHTGPVLSVAFSNGIKDRILVSG